MSGLYPVRNPYGNQLHNTSSGGPGSDLTTSSPLNWPPLAYFTRTRKLVSYNNDFCAGFARLGHTGKRERNPANERARGRADLNVVAGNHWRSAGPSRRRRAEADPRCPQAQTFHSSDVSGSDTGTEAGAPPP